MNCGHIANINLDMSQLKSAKITTGAFQDIIDLYKKDIDRTLIRENLKLTPEQRILKLQNFQQFAFQMQEAGRKTRKSKRDGKPK